MMIKFYSRLIIIGIIFSTVPIGSHAGFLNNLFGLGSYQDCIEVGLKKAKVSREIKKIYDVCKRDYPDEGRIQGPNKQSTIVPSIATPRVPVVLTPLVPFVPTPIK